MCSVAFAISAQSQMVCERSGICAVQLRKPPTCQRAERAGPAQAAISYLLSKQRGLSRMLQALDFLREMTFLSVALRLMMAMFCGGLIGSTANACAVPRGCGLSHLYDGFCRQQR